MPFRLAKTVALSAANPFQSGDEVQHYRQKAGNLDRERQRNKGKGVSAFGLNASLQQESVKKHCELYVVQVG